MSLSVERPRLKRWRYIARHERTNGRRHENSIAESHYGRNAAGAYRRVGQSRRNNGAFGARQLAIGCEQVRATDTCLRAGEQ